MRARVAQRFLANASLCGLGLLLSLGAGEVFVRHVAPQHFPLAVALRGLHVPDAELGYVMRGAFSRRVHNAEFTCDVATNSLGLRGGEIPPRTPGTLRLLALGDSFTLGIHAGPLDSCFVERLQAALSQNLAHS